MSPTGNHSASSSSRYYQALGRRPAGDVSDDSCSIELSIDTSTDFSSIALSQQGRTLAELTWYSRQSHTVELVPNIKELLNRSRLSPRSLSVIFVAKGPGSFNGLRVGMSIAKGLAFALNIPLVGVSTLEIEAYPFAFTGLPVCPIHNAGRGEIATAVYRQNGGWQCLIEEHITTVDALCQRTRDRTLFCGEIPAPVIEQLQQRLGEFAMIPGAEARLRHASYLAALGWQRLSQGKQDNPAALQPLYLRPPPITQRKK
ncbi:MAG TPA: tRNA (adenosine(37)-N6)-threonylcarbamoyltransferase complex dimerization subunit type 1 TsaB [Dehalococcoidia bacterium]|nr:tRNA (adenosine(37)-N6)-threonylcarbamoyltransferase complex dimerization subunit type 1 TsaB [Dehalococcoidia bacterium]